MVDWTFEEEKLLKKEYIRGTPLQVIQTMVPLHTIEAIEKKRDRLGIRRKHEDLIYNKKVGYLDIETDNLNADVGIMLSYQIKTRDKEIFYSDNINKEDWKCKDKFLADKRIVQRLIEDMSNFDVLVTYNGTRFDIPFIRARAIKHKIDFPGYGASTHIDLYYIARSKLKITRKSLENVCKLMGIEGKTKLDMSVWFNARYGDEKAMKYIENQELHHYGFH